MDQIHMEQYQNLARNIRRFHKKAGLTQAGLAIKANISRGYLSQIEAEHVEKAPSLDMVFHIARALKIPVYRLFMPHGQEG